MDSDFAVAAEYPRILMRILNIKSDELPIVLEGTSLQPQQFLTLEGYLSWNDQHRLLKNTLRQYNKPGLGLMVAQKHPQPTSLGVLGIAAMSCETALEALHTSIRYQAIRSRLFNSCLIETKDSLLLRLELEFDLDEVGVFLLEAALGCTAHSLALLFGQKVKDIQLRIASPQPDHADLYEKYLPCNIHFDQSHTQFQFPKHFGSQAIPTHNIETKRFALEMCDRQLQRLQSFSSFAERTRKLLRLSPGQPPHQDQVARQLNVSSRTLSRRLKEEGFSYTQLVDQEHKRLARHYFDNTTLNIETIATLVGYQDSSSFRRAFKRWFDISPSEYPRKPNLATP